MKKHIFDIDLVGLVITPKQYTEKTKGIVRWVVAGRNSLDEHMIVPAGTTFEAGTLQCTDNITKHFYPVLDGIPSSWNDIEGYSLPLIDAEPQDMLQLAIGSIVANVVVEEHVGTTMHITYKFLSVASDWYFTTEPVVDLIALSGGGKYTVTRKQLINNHTPCKHIDGMGPQPYSSWERIETVTNIMDKLQPPNNIIDLFP